MTVTGTNDVPTVTALDLAGDITEFVGKPAAGADLSDSGALSFADVDVADDHTVSVAKVGTTLGSVTASVQADTVGGTGGAVDWTYQVTASKLEYLAEGEQKVENFNVTVKDGHGGNTTQLVTVTLTGTNDAVTTGTADQLRGVAAVSVFHGDVEIVDLLSAFSEVFEARRRHLIGPVDGPAGFANPLSA